LDVLDEVNRHKEYHQIQRNGERLIGKKEDIVVDTSGVYGGIPEPLYWRTAENADQELRKQSTEWPSRPKDVGPRTAAIPQAIFSAAAICIGRLAVVTRKMRQYRARRESLLRLSAIG